MAQKIQAEIVSVRPLNDTIWQYILKPKQFIPYQAGQYLQIHKPDGVHFYSIANAPYAEQHYELHVRHRSSSPLGKAGESIFLSLPYGCCDLRHLYVDRPILFLAFGTGFVPIRAMIQALLHQQDPRWIELHWGIGTKEDEYDRVSIEQWQQLIHEFHYHSHITASNDSEVISSWLKHYGDLKTCQIVMAGPFDLMLRLKKECLNLGMNPSMLFSDAFEFA